MIRVVLFGACGRMGGMVAEELAAADDIELVALVESLNHPALRTKSGSLEVTPDNAAIPEADCWVDFTLAAPAVEHARRAAERSIPIVIGTTGFDAAQQESLRSASERCPVLLLPNMSVGMGVMNRLTGDAARLMAGSYDVVLSELHHTAKRDAPSGTARMLAESVNAAIGCYPETTAQRAGGAIGEHTLRFVGQDDELVITHRAWSRRAFSRGAPAAVRFLVGKPAGLYGMRDMYG